MKGQEIKWLEWKGNVREWGKIQCPMFNNKMIMTYCPKEGHPSYYSYTAPFIDSDGDVCYYRYDHDEDCWDEDTLFTICSSEEYQEGMAFVM